MLMNLSPARNFRSQMSIHKKNLRKWCAETKEEKKDIKRLSFNEIFKPTKYVGLYASNFDDGIIRAWCKQNPVNYKLFRILRDIDDVETRSTLLRNAWDFGVADNYEQIIDYYNNRDPKIYIGNHVISTFVVRKGHNGGWRWHKWGQYIGTQNPHFEYLDDEPEIEEVICYSIYKVI